jgi:Holliday junction resolvase-like predicted endonuclease
VTGAHWASQDEFPAFRSWADDTERILAFIYDEGRFDTLFPRLHRTNAEHRTAALTEARAAWFLHQLGFSILEWEPIAINQRPGDLMISLVDSRPVFVEVKAPTWQGELGRALKTVEPNKAQQIVDRIDQVKYINADARFVDPVGVVIDVIAKNAIPKLGDDRPNLVVVGDDLFFSPVESPLSEHQFREAFRTRSELNRVGGVLLLSPQSHSGEVVYHCEFEVNYFCLVDCGLPHDVRATLAAAGARSAARDAEIEARFRSPENND